ncbi:spore germination protein GerPC [Paenibacillus nasutitermitis]|uniref:Germination protein PC n=1 Tax=Paenibacillus nasutitermitis TaxID=1652958 RepID=A0A916YY87_9BACL|nr:spore germination protein GerPC [Paenibacillus nasutitermitis]GGD65475.1 germination protein PC [Paenibacillus nasutitermitis]
MQFFNEAPYPPGQAWMAWNERLHHLQCQLEEQQALINSLCKQVENLSERVKAAETRPQYHIDRMEYHFDQLKVEKLDGTLNIGMTPPGEEQLKEIGQLVVPAGPSHAHPESICTTSNEQGGAPNGQALSGSNQFPSSFASGSPDATMPGYPYPEIRREIDFYLNTRGPVILQQLEANYQTPLDPYHRRLILEDIRKQMGPRIQFYTNASMTKSGAASPCLPEMMEQLQTEVIQKTTRDIDTALQSYVRGLAAQTNPLMKE